MPGVDAFGQQLERQTAQRSGQLIERCFIAVPDVDLYDVEDGQQRCAALVEPAVAGQCQRVATVAQGAATAERQFVRCGVER